MRWKRVGQRLGNICDVISGSNGEGVLDTDATGESMRLGRWKEMRIDGGAGIQCVVQDRHKLTCGRRILNAQSGYKRLSPAHWSV